MSVRTLRHNFSAAVGPVEPIQVVAAANRLKSMRPYISKVSAPGRTHIDKVRKAREAGAAGALLRAGCKLRVRMRVGPAHR